MEIYFKGGDTEDVSRFEPSQLPNENDTVIFDQCTEDVICNKMPSWGALKMTNFKNDIYYFFPEYHQSGCFRNEEKDMLFSYIGIRRIE